MKDKKSLIITPSNNSATFPFSSGFFSYRIRAENYGFIFQLNKLSMSDSARSSIVSTVIAEKNNIASVL